MLRILPTARAIFAAIALAAAVSCSNSTGQPGLAGTYSLVAADGAYIPVRFEPLYPTLPHTWITGGSLNVLEADSMHLILHLQDRDANGTTVGTPPDIDQWILFVRTGDSLVVSPPSLFWGGEVLPPDVRLHVGFPAHPSTGLSVVEHTLFFQR